METPAQEIKEPVPPQPDLGCENCESEPAAGSSTVASDLGKESTASEQEKPVSETESGSIEEPAEIEVDETGVESMPPPAPLTKHVELKMSATAESSEAAKESAEAEEEPEDLEKAKDSERLVAFLKAAPKLADAISSLRKEKKDLAHNAARALHHAFGEWSIISEGLQKKPKPKIVDHSEEQLVHYWKAAALAVAQFDEKSGKRCEATADLLANVSKLTKVELKTLTGRLDEACRKFDTLLSTRLWVTGQTGRPASPPQG
jgi:hypothetical protein